MKSIQSNNGFTIIETLVAINISFIAITMIFSFYLFAEKFTKNFSDNYSEKFKLLSSFNLLENTLRKCDEYEIIIQKGSIDIYTSEYDSICITQYSILLNRTFLIDSPENLNISISISGQEEFLVRNNIIVTELTELSTSNNIITSTVIDYILFNIENNKHSMSYKIINSSISINHFNNIPTKNTAPY